jgi:hypothetical protein
MSAEEGKLEAKDPIDLIKVITEAYKRGWYSGYANIYNAEFVGEDQSKLMPTEEEVDVVNELVNKYNKLEL